MTHERDFRWRHVAVMVRGPNDQRHRARDVAEARSEFRRLACARHRQEGLERRVEIARLAERVAQNDALRHPRGSPDESSSMPRILRRTRLIPPSSFTHGR